MEIKFANKANYKAIKQLYQEAFPKEERLPFFMLKHGVKKGKASIIIAIENGKLIAFAYSILYKDMVYLFYFAIIPEMRCMGRGSTIIQYLKKLYLGKRFFLAVEHPSDMARNTDIRTRRKNFYIKNGFTDLECKIKEHDITFDIMGLGGNISNEEYVKMFDFFGGKILPLFLKINVIE